MRPLLTNAQIEATSIAIIGQTGSGKTYTAKWVAEKLIKRSRRVIVIDPMGVWAGLKLNADGVSPGLPVLVLGGVHGDIELPTASEASGAKLAKFLLSTEVSAIVDVSEMRRPDNLLFVGALLKGLYEGHRDGALFLILEEADLFAPQSARSAHDKHTRAEVEMIARRGRVRGLRLITLTQRPAVIDKNVTSQVGCMIALALPGTRDRKAVFEYLDGVSTEAHQVYDTLPTLAVGEAWVWSPQSKKLTRGQFPLIATFDSSATPDAGRARSVKSGLSEAKLTALQSAYAATVGGSSGILRSRDSVSTPTPAGLAITRLRERLRLTQKELAELVGCQQKSLSRAETGQINVSTALLNTIAEKTETELRVEFVK